MIPLSQLYTQDDRRGAKTTWQHHMGIAQVCQTGDPSLLPTIKATMGFSSLAFQAVAADHHSQYLLGSDTRGWQVGLATNFGQLADVWRTAMLAGLATDVSLADRALKYCIDAATIIAADLAPRITDNREVLFFGHGIAGGILAVVREKLRVAGKRVSNLWQTSAPRFATEETALGLAAPSSLYLKPEDAFAFVPPVNVMTSFEPPGVLPELFTCGEISAQARFGVNMARFYNVAATSQDPVGWTDYITDDVAVFAGVRYYQWRHWYTMSAREQAISIEWFNLLNSLFGYTLDRRLS